MSGALPITEQGNHRSSALDGLSIADGVRLFHDIDMEMFFGGTAGRGIEGVILELAEVANRIQYQLSTGSIDRVCFSGSGTSGRLCYIASVLACRASSASLIRYNMNGGLGALFRSRPGIEDDFHRGVSEVTALSPAERRTALIGVSCGLSAPYIAGQLHEALHSLAGQVVALGFNPPAMARSEVRGEGFVSFRDVLAGARRSDRFSLLAPIVEPEAVAGSVRLKAGTATLIMLGALATFLLRRRDGEHCRAEDHIAEFVARSTDAIDAAHTANHDLICALVEVAAGRIRSGARTHVVSDAPLGLLAVADCAECPPTFGARYEDFVGYCAPQFISNAGSGGFDRTSHSHVPIAHGRMTNHPTAIGPDDLVIILGRAPATFSQHASALILDIVNDSIGSYPVKLESGRAVLGLSSPAGFGEFFQFIQAKTFLNTVSSLTFSQTGKIYGNVMIDLKVSNAKLFDRAVEIIAAVCNCARDDALQALLRAIYVEADFDQLSGRAILDHVEQAAGRERLVPLAVLLHTRPALGHAEAVDVVRQGFSLRQSFAAEMPAHV